MLVHGFLREKVEKWRRVLNLCEGKTIAILGNVKSFLKSKRGKVREAFRKLIIPVALEAGSLTESCSVFPMFHTICILKELEDLLKELRIVMIVSYFAIKTVSVGHTDNCLFRKCYKPEPSMPRD